MNLCVWGLHWDWSLYYHNNKHYVTVQCLPVSSNLVLVSLSLYLYAWTVQAHTSPYCAASRHAIDLALLRYHLLFLTFPSQHAWRIYFLLLPVCFPLSCVPLHWGLGILYCLPYSTIPSICFRQVITLALLASCSFISFTSQPSSAHLSWPYFFLYFPPASFFFLVVYRLCVASSLLSSPLFTSRSSPPFLRGS